MMPVQVEKGVETMSSSTTTEQVLAQRWQERVRTGQFSQAVLGLGTIRVMGRSGDAALAFPRISSLQALDQLEPDEQWAVRAAEALVTQARTQGRTVLAAQPPTATAAPSPPAPVTHFDPQTETLLVVSMITGG
jgi:hypothetical protein